jgi:hypothetical protein
MEAFHVEDSRKSGVGHKCLELRSKEKLTWNMIIEERLFSRPISGKEEISLSAVVNTEREHPIETKQAMLAPGTVSLKEDFRVASCAENMAFFFQLLAEFQKIVNFSVKYNGVSA